MKMQVPDFESLAKRLDKVETKNRRASRMGLLASALGLVAGLILGAICAVGFSAPPPLKIVEAEEIRVMAKGKICARIIGSTIMLFDRDGYGRLVMAVGSHTDEPGIIFYDKYAPSIEMIVLRNDQPSIQISKKGSVIWKAPPGN